MVNQETRKPVQTVERSLTILFHVAHTARPMTLTEISAGTSVDKATALRLLGTLQDFNLVSRDPVKLVYVIGPAALHLAGAMQGSLQTMSLPHLTTLRDKTEESASLNVQRGLERVALLSVEARHELRVVPSPNSAAPIYSGASGLAFMAFMPPANSARIIEITGLDPVNQRGISEPGQFLEEMNTVRRQGYAVTRGDVTPGAAAIAAPVLDSAGSPLAVVSLRGPDVRMSAARIAEIAPMVLDAASRISADLLGATDADLSEGK